MRRPKVNQDAGRSLAAALFYEFQKEHRSLTRVLNDMEKSGMEHVHAAEAVIASSRRRQEEILWRLANARDDGYMEKVRKITVIDMTIPSCAWCGKALTGEDPRAHAIECEKQPLAVYRRAFIEAAKRKPDLQRVAEILIDTELQAMDAVIKYTQGEEE